MKRVALLFLSLALPAHLLAVKAQTPACGSTVTANITFDADLVCAASFTGIALDLTASGITVDGAGFKIDAPGSGLVVDLSGVSNAQLKNLTIVGAGTPSGAVHSDSGSSNSLQNLDISFVGGAGIGINLGSGASNYQITDVVVNGADQAVLVSGGSGHTITRLTATGSGTGDGVFIEDTPNIVIVDSVVGSFGNGVRIRNLNGTASGNQVKNNDLSGNINGILIAG